MAKEKSINPAQAQRKLEKQKALKKGKADQLARRTERLAHRNPERLQRQADELREAEAAGQVLNNREKKLLEELERDVKAVRKARETLGDKAPQVGSARGHADRGREREHSRGGSSRGGRGGPLLGKRRRDDGVDGGESDSSTTESVKNIPMPRDTPPPIPEEFLRRHQFGRGRDAGNPNLTPLDENNLRLPARPDNGTAGEGTKAETEEKPKVRTVYEAAPVVRDLRKEAVSAFMPSVVRQQIDAKRGKGGKLLEPEELERLEKGGYGDKTSGDGGELDASRDAGEAEDEAARALRELEEEQRSFELEMMQSTAQTGHARQVQVEEVEDVEDEDA